jgi:hypothetical protein
VDVESVAHAFSFRPGFARSQLALSGAEPFERFALSEPKEISSTYQLVTRRRKPLKRERHT